MNVFAKLVEIPSMILEVIKKTKCYGHMDGPSVGRSDNMKTVLYTLPQTQFAGGYNKQKLSIIQALHKMNRFGNLIRDIAIKKWDTLAYKVFVPP